MTLPMLAPQNFNDLCRFAEMASQTDLVPRDYRGKPSNIILAVMWGNELGLGATQSLASVAVINGRACVWGDALIGIVRASPVCEYITESVSDTEATCIVKRKGEPEQSRTFTIEDAQKAGLWGKAGPWTQYPKRMLQMRARGFACRDVFADVLRGVSVAEEVQDYPQAERDITPAPVEVQSLPPAQEKTSITTEGFAKALEKIQAGELTVERLLEKRTLTAEQMEALANLGAENDSVQ